jgi:hypothetical protein
VHCAEDVACEATSSAQCTHLATQLSSITTLQQDRNHRHWNAVRPSDDGRTDARNMLRNNWLPINHYLLHLVGSCLYLFTNLQKLWLCLIFLTRQSVPKTMTYQWTNHFQSKSDVFRTHKNFHNFSTIKFFTFPPLRLWNCNDHKGLRLPPRFGCVAPPLTITLSLQEAEFYPSLHLMGSLS